MFFAELSPLSLLAAHLTKHLRVRFDSSAADGVAPRPEEISGARRTRTWSSI